MPGRLEDLIEHRSAALSSVRLQYVTAGSGPLVILLHGFPEFWFSWRHQIPALVNAGYRVVAPDMRGYNESDKPAGLASYQTDVLARDIVELIAHVGEERATVVGHDWGGFVAWWTANNHPRVVERLCVLNCPHPGHGPRMLRDLDQLRRSWYILFFQLPWLPERYVSRHDFALLRTLLEREPTHPDAFGPADIERYVEVAQKPGVATATINYYRALRRTLFRRELHVLPMPVRVIWGARDRHLALRYAAPPPRHVPLCDLQVLEDASHWVQNDAPDRVNALLLEFLGAPANGAAPC